MNRPYWTVADLLPGARLAAELAEERNSKGPEELLVEHLRMFAPQTPLAQAMPCFIWPTSVLVLAARLVPDGEMTWDLSDAREEARRQEEAAAANVRKRAELQVAAEVEAMASLTDEQRELINSFRNTTRQTYLDDPSCIPQPPALHDAILAYHSARGVAYRRLIFADAGIENLMEHFIDGGDQTQAEVTP